METFDPEKEPEISQGTRETVVARTEDGDLKLHKHRHGEFFSFGGRVFRVEYREVGSHTTYRGTTRSETESTGWWLPSPLFQTAVKHGPSIIPAGNLALVRMKGSYSAHGADLDYSHEIELLVQRRLVAVMSVTDFDRND